MTDTSKNATRAPFSRAEIEAATDAAIVALTNERGAALNRIAELNTDLCIAIERAEKAERMFSDLTVSGHEAIRKAASAQEIAEMVAEEAEVCILNLRTRAEAAERERDNAYGDTAKSIIGQAIARHDLNILGACADQMESALAKIANGGSRYGDATGCNPQGFCDIACAAISEYHFRRPAKMVPDSGYVGNSPNGEKPDAALRELLVATLIDKARVRLSAVRWEARAIEREAEASERQAEILALRARVAALEGRARDLIDGAQTTYKARNGRVCGIEADDGEMCFIVHSDFVTALEAALSAPPAPAATVNDPLTVGAAKESLTTAAADVLADAERYRWLRARDLDTIHKGGVFAGMTPDNVVLNGEDLDNAVDAARLDRAAQAEREG